MESIDELASRGEQVMRVFYVDGYGSDLALVSLVRAPGRDIRLEVRVPRSPEVNAQLLTADVPLPDWDRLTAAARHFDRVLVPRSNVEPGLCMHSWVYTAEVSDGPRGSVVRRAVQNACEDGLVQTFALEIARRALELLPPCKVLNPDQHRNDVAILAACTALSGDRIAAAQAMNALRTMVLRMPLILVRRRAPALAIVSGSIFKAM